MQNRRLGQQRNTTKAKRSSHGKCRDKINAGRTKSGLPWTVEVVAVEVTDEKSTREAARTEAWAVSWPEHPQAWPSSTSSWQN